MERMGLRKIKYDIWFLNKSYEFFKVVVDFSRAYWYMVTAAVAALFGAALNVMRIYEDSLDDDQQRLIPEELRWDPN